MAEPWTMPEWMKPYAEHFMMLDRPTVAEVERMMNHPQTADPALAAVIVAIDAQRAMLTRLMRAGLLLAEVPVQRKPAPKTVKPKNRKARRNAAR